MVLNDSSCLEKDVKKEKGISADCLGQLLQEDLKEGFRPLGDPYRLQGDRQLR